MVPPMYVVHTGVHMLTDGASFVVHVYFVFTSSFVIFLTARTTWSVTYKQTNMDPIFSQGTPVQ